MRTEETNEKASKAKSADLGCAPMGQRMFEMMNACCTGQGGTTDCSTMLKGMTEAMRNQSCCSPGSEDTESGREKK